MYVYFDSIIAYKIFAVLLLISTDEFVWCKKFVSDDMLVECGDVFANVITELFSVVTLRTSLF